MLRVGEIVRGPQWPETVEIKKCEPVDFGFYLVEALGRDTRAYYETLLEEFQFGLVERLSEARERPSLSASDLQRYMQYLVLEEEGKYAKTRALGNRHVIPLPHQIEAVYSRMLQSPQVRFLLADDPGAGKTVMSGMLIRELQARGMVDRILILVPPLVLMQWRDEFLEKFMLDFRILSRTSISESGGKNPFAEYPFCLASIYWAARDDIKHLVRDVSFDLVIVDEAHKMAAYTQGKKVRKTKRTEMLNTERLFTLSFCYGNFTCG
jgi:superfamily II DNA or RNA helicase